MAIDYKAAGVDREAGYEEVRKIKEIVKATNNENVLSKIGGFSGLYKLQGYKNPILVTGTDGVGTKLKLAFMTGIHNTVGIDLVAMSVNDILCQGAKPLFFLDYIGCSHLDADKMAEIVKGVADGCVQSGCALIGGETAEMPGFYDDGEYDMAGFAVGVVEEDKILDGSKIKEGDILIGLKSSGFHSNGYSLIRKLVFEDNKFSPDHKLSFSDKPLAEELLTPTKIYYNDVKDLLELDYVNALVHITGGGLYENVPRILPNDLDAEFDLKNYEVPEIFNFIGELGNVEEKEMFSTFNMGLGMIMFVSKENIYKAKEILDKNNTEYLEVGKVVKGTGNIKIWR